MTGKLGRRTRSKRSSLRLRSSGSLNPTTASCGRRPVNSRSACPVLCSGTTTQSEPSAKCVHCAYERLSKRSTTTCVLTEVESIQQISPRTQRPTCTGRANDRHPLPIVPPLPAQKNGQVPVHPTTVPVSQAEPHVIARSTLTSEEGFDASSTSPLPRGVALIANVVGNNDHPPTLSLHMACHSEHRAAWMHLSAVVEINKNCDPVPRRVRDHQRESARFVPLNDAVPTEIHHRIAFTASCCISYRRYVSYLP